MVEYTEEYKKFVAEERLRRRISGQSAPQPKAKPDIEVVEEIKQENISSFNGELTTSPTIQFPVWKRDTGGSGTL